MTTDITKRFHQLRTAAKLVRDTLPSAADHAPAYRAVLEFVQAHPEHKAEFSRAFSDTLADAEKGHWELTAFCMHTLRWEEIRREAERLIRESGEPHVKSAAERVIAAYSDTWAEAVFYAPRAAREDKSGPSGAHPFDEDVVVGSPRSPFWIGLPLFPFTVFSGRFSIGLGDPARPGRVLAIAVLIGFYFLFGKDWNPGGYPVFLFLILAVLLCWVIADVRTLRARRLKSRV